jgi:hypothetical protein
MTLMGSGEEPRITHLPEDQPGSVRDRWNKVVGIISKTGGEWVGVSMVAANQPGFGSRI